MSNEWSLQDERVVSVYWSLLDCGFSEETAYWVAQAFVDGRYGEIVDVLRARA